MQMLIEADERITQSGGLTHEEFWRAVEAETTKPKKPLKSVRRTR